MSVCLLFCSMGLYTDVHKIKNVLKDRYLRWDSCNSSLLWKINQLSTFNIIMSTCWYLCGSASVLAHLVECWINCLARGFRFKPQYIEAKCLCSISMYMQHNYVIDVFIIFMLFDMLNSLNSFNNCNLILLQIDIWNKVQVNIINVVCRLR